MDPCDAERNPISLAAVRAPGDGFHNVLLTDVFLIGFGHERMCANPCPLAQEIQWSIVLFVDGTRQGFESGSRAWELNVGEWERASGPPLS